MLQTPITARIIAPPIFTEECPDCSGSGHWLDSVRWSGEAYGEQVERTCETCDGLGTVECEPKCSYCDDAPAADDGLCGDCFEEVNGQFGVGA